MDRRCSLSADVVNGVDELPLMLLGIAEQTMAMAVQKRATEFGAGSVASKCGKLLKRRKG